MRIIKATTKFLLRSAMDFFCVAYSRHRSKRRNDCRQFIAAPRMRHYASSKKEKFMKCIAQRCRKIKRRRWIIPKSGASKFIMTKRRKKREALALLRWHRKVRAPTSSVYAASIHNVNIYATTHLMCVFTLSFIHMHFIMLFGFRFQHDEFSTSASDFLVFGHRRIACERCSHLVSLDKRVRLRP